MKIALVILHADPMRGGAERYTLDLAAALQKRGHDVSLLATTFNEIPPQLRQVSLPASGLTRTRRYFRALDSLDSHLAAETYDVVHAMFPVRRCNLYHPHAGLAADAKMDWLNPRRKAMAKIERELLITANPPRVLCLSEYMKQSVKKSYPLDDAHLPVLFNAVDLQRFDPTKCAAKKSDEIIALIIAQDFFRKGVREAILALANVPGVVLRVVGRPSPRAYQRFAIVARVANRVRFIGPVRNTVPEYCSADFFVLPTKHDPCSLVVLEALAMGLPVISTKFNGACEIMTDAAQGFILPDPKNIDALADAMNKLVDATLRAKMSAAALQLRSRLSFENHVDQLIEIYSRQ